jgi:(p)ppGpp synthase/HD superfamily hydrolase
MSQVTVLTDRFDRALLYATHVHGGQARKGTCIPYVAHLLAVAAMYTPRNQTERLRARFLRRATAQIRAGAN